MKKAAAFGICVLIFLLSLAGCTAQEFPPPDVISVETAYGPCRWGMTKEEVFEALSIQEDQIIEEEFVDDGYAVSVSWNQPVYGLKVASLSFRFDPLKFYAEDSVPGLIGVQITYLKESQVEDIWNSVTTAYKTCADFEVREELPDRTAVWAETKETLNSQLTQPAKDFMGELLTPDSESSDPVEDLAEQLERKSLVTVSVVGQEYFTADSVYNVTIEGYNQQIAEILNQRFPET